MPLTATAIRNAKPGEKTIKLFNGRRLYLEVSPAGGKWCLRDYSTMFACMMRFNSSIRSARKACNALSSIS